MLALMDILRDVPLIDFDECLSWQGMCVSDMPFTWKEFIYYLDWALPDQLVFSTVSALLRLSSSYLQYAEWATSSICDFIAQTVKKIETGSGTWHECFTIL